jgi:ADP-ribosylglycohydrolase
VSAEPDDLPGILAECRPASDAPSLRSVPLAAAEARVRAAFLGRVCGCMLGKPVEGCADLAGLRAAGQRTGEWPIRDYLSEEFLDALGARHPDWRETVRGRINAVAPDDDLNYTLLATLVLEERGLEFTRDDLRRAWLRNLAPGWTWGPEREFLVAAAAASLSGDDAPGPVEPVEPLEPGPRLGLAADGGSAILPAAPHCGAAIRADAYGYACMGDPGRAAALAWRDAGMTHRGAGIYGAMFVAAAIAAAPAVSEPLQMFSVALGFVPERSAFYRIVSDCLSIVAGASDWLSGYERIHSAYGQWGFCEVYQECGTLINTLAFAKDVADGICIQVSQGNDTDSFGATAGSLLGAWFGPDALPRRWLEPFGNRIKTALATFHDQDLEAVASRVGRLPQLTLA